MFGREMKVIKGREKEQALQKVGQKGILCRPLVKNRHHGQVIHMETNMQACPQPAPKGGRRDHWDKLLVAMFTDNQVGGHCNWNQQ